MIVKRKLDRRLEWFPRARFGMFVHFGLYALLGRGEWVMYHENIPREEYEKLMRRFNPHRFDADEWVGTAKRAGARYITVTTKHHDGFCLFDSSLTDFKITNTPFARDLIGELVEACHRGGMRIIFYYSQPDWHHPNFVHRKGAFKDLQYERPGDEPNWPKFLEYVEGQIVELCTKYGRIDGIWFDGVHKTEREWRGRHLYQLIKHYQPDAVVNDRAGYGDFFTPERQLSFRASAAGYTVESCQSICQEAWGYRRDATLFSSTFLIESMVRMAAAGGNYLLNIGPKPDGTLPADQVQRLEEIGDWLRVYGKAVYDTLGCPLSHESDEMLYTRRGKRLYLHLLRWPETDRLVLRKLRRKPIRARLLGANARLRAGSADGCVVLRGLPSTPPNPAVNVVEMTFDDEAILRPVPRPEPATVHRLNADETLILPAHTAMRRGFGPKGSTIEVKTIREAEVEVVREAETSLVGWGSAEQRAAWKIECAEPVRCEVAVEMGCPELYSGSTFAVKVAGQTLRGVVPATKSYGDFAQVTVGTVDLPAGEFTLTIVPERLNYGYIFAAVRRVVVRPTGE